MLKQPTKKLLASWGITIEGDAVKFDLSKIGIDQAALIAAEKDTKEVDFEVKIKPEGFNVLDETELTDLKTRVEGDAKTAAEKSVPEILAAAYKEKYGVKLESTNMDEVIEAIALARSTEAVSKLNLTIDEQVKLKDADLATVRQNYADLEKEVGVHKGEVEKWKGEFEGLKESQGFASFLGDRINPLLKPNEYRQRLLEEEGVQFKNIDGVWTAMDAKGGVIKDKMAKPVAANDKLAEILGRRKEWTKPESAAAPVQGGHGTGGSGGGAAAEKKYGSMSQLKAAAAEGKWNQKTLKAEYDKAAIVEGFDANS